MRIADSVREPMSPGDLSQRLITANQNKNGAR
jgi:hypothetical protein